MLALGPTEPQLTDRPRAVGEQAGAIVGVDPGPGDDAGAVERADVALVRLDHRVDDVGGDEAALDQQGFEGGHPPLDRRRLGRVVRRLGHVRYRSHRSMNKWPGSASSPHRSRMANRTVYVASGSPSSSPGGGHPPGARTTSPVTPRT